MTTPNFIQKKWTTAKYLLGAHYNAFTLVPEEDRTLITAISANEVHKFVLKKNNNYAFCNSTGQKFCIKFPLMGLKKLGTRVEGSIEATRTGSIVFLHYRLSKIQKGLFYLLGFLWAAILVLLATTKLAFMIPLGLVAALGSYLPIIYALKRQKKRIHDSLIQFLEA